MQLVAYHAVKQSLSKSILRGSAAFVPVSTLYARKEARDIQCLDDMMPNDSDG